MIELIRRTIDEKGHLTVPARMIDPDANLYEAGLSPFAAIQVMIALEAACGGRISQPHVASAELLVAQFDRRLSGARGTQGGVRAG